MNEKRKSNINTLYNDVIDVVEFLEKNDPENFQEYFKTYNKSNSFIINRYYENDVVELIKNEYDVEIGKKYNTYELNNKKYYDVELIILDKLFQIIPIKKEKLIEIFQEKINDVNKIFNCHIKNISDIIEININYIYQLDNNNYLNHYSINNYINSYDLLKLFDHIIDDINEYNYDVDNDEKIDPDEIIKLFEYVIDELNYLSNLNEMYHYFNSNRKFKINLDSSLKYLCTNNKFNIHDTDEILYDLLYNDYYEFYDDELKKIFDPEINIDINELLFMEYSYINNLNNEGFNFNYHVEIDDKFNYNEWYIEISINDILKLNKNIKDINNLLFDPFKIDEIFENYNNNYDDESFIYLIFENEYEILSNTDIFYNNCYYELNHEKFHNIYDLNKYVLNILSHYNLNNSFKFNDDVYNIY